jgi:hypothetical protein
MKSLRTGAGVSTLLLSVILLGTSNVALAKDALKASFSPGTTGFTFDANGNPLSLGTYAIGTLKIYMIIVADEWPATLPSVQLDLAVEQRKTNPATKYSVPIALRPLGGSLVLDPVASNFEVTGPTWTGYSIIGVSVPQKVLDDPAMNADGTELVGNLQTETTATRTGFDTVTTVKIHATLVHPTAACLKTATFVTNTPLNRNLSSSSDGLDFTWGYKTAGPNTTFEWTVDPNNTQIRDQVIVVNTCVTEQYYDARIGLPTGFQATSPGNVVESFVSLNANASSFPFSDPYQELKDAIGNSEFPANGTEAGTALCVQNNTLAGEHSQWLRAKVELTGPFNSESDIPDPNSATPAYNPFTSDLYEQTVSPAPGCAVPHTSSVGQGTAGVYVKSKTCTPGGNTSCSAP